MIGLKSGTVKLYDHQKEWDIEAQKTVSALWQILGDVAKDIQHVGSTAITSIKAKPIIDIAVGVDSFEHILALEPILRSNGFYYRPNAHLNDQLLFACGSRYDGTGDIQTHFIHVVIFGGMEWQNYLNFRDYLNKTPSVAKEYEALKVALANAAPEDKGREKYLEGKHDFIVYALRNALVNSYLGKTVDIKIDRPIGYVHQKEDYSLTYPINYGYIPGVLGGDGEELDVYLLGVSEPVKEYTARVIGIVHRENDIEDKLIAAPDKIIFNQAEMAEAIHFQEQYYQTHIEAIYHKSCGAVIFRRNNGSTEYLCILQQSGTYSVPKGHVEAFETEEQTAKREIFEEIGISVEFVSGFRKQIHYGLSSIYQKDLVLFLAEYNGELKIDNDEISDYRWLNCHWAKQTLPKWYGEIIDFAEVRLKEE